MEDKYFCFICVFTSFSFFQTRKNKIRGKKNCVQWKNGITLASNHRDVVPILGMWTKLKDGTWDLIAKSSNLRQHKTYLLKNKDQGSKGDLKLKVIFRRRMDHERNLCRSAWVSTGCDGMASGERELPDTPFLSLYNVAFKLREISMGQGLWGGRYTKIEDIIVSLRGFAINLTNFLKTKYWGRYSFMSMTSRYFMRNYL